MKKKKNNMVKNIYKEKLENFIIESSLGENEKLLWELFLRFSTVEEDEAILEVAEEDKENLELLTKHLKDKIWDMKEANKNAWEKLIKEEKKFAVAL